MSLGERLLKYAETVITLSKALEETRGHIRDIRGGVSDNRERIIRLEEKVDAIVRNWTCEIRRLPGAFPTDSGKTATAEETGAVDEKSVTFRRQGSAHSTTLL
jgi:hypothetical protein